MIRRIICTSLQDKLPSGLPAILKPASSATEISKYVDFSMEQG